jgi:hypothetical protein
MPQWLHKIFERRETGPILVLGILVAILLLLIVKPAQDSGSRAKMANAFVNSIGVATHIKFLDTPYADYERVKAALGELGVKHIRDSVVYNQDWRDATVYGRYRDLNASFGIKAMLYFNPDNTGLDTIDAAKMNYILSKMGPALELIEGPNEYNATNADGVNPDWGAELEAYQAGLYNAVQASKNPDMPVACPPLQRPYPPIEEVPVLEGICDYRNMHSYPAGNPPMMGAPSDPSDYSIVLDRDVPMANYVADNPSLPITASETGYQTSTDGQGISEMAHAKYAPRLAFEYFNAGITRGYHYQLLDHFNNGDADPQSHFGFLRMDFRRKPVFRAMENTIDILEDPGPAFATSSLDYTLAKTTPDIHQTLLQKRDGTFYLAVWREVRSYDLEAKRDISVPSAKATLTLNQPITQAATYLPSESNAPVKRYTEPRRLTVYVPDEVLLVELTPSNASTLGLLGSRLPRADVRDGGVDLTESGARLRKGRG